MMRDINFTNLGTVRLTNDELTNELFFNKMNRLINDNVSLNRVIYDENDDCYKIIYHGDEYEVKYRNSFLTSKCEKQDIIYSLNKLVDLSKYQKTIQEEKNCHEEEKIKIKQELIDKVKNGIVNSNEEKMTKISIIDDEYKNNKTKIFKLTWKKIKDINVSMFVRKNNLISGIRLFSVLITALAFLCELGFFISSSEYVVIFLMLPTLGAFADSCFFIHQIKAGSFLDDRAYSGIYATIASIIALPFLLGYYTTKRFIEIIKRGISIHNVKKTITDLKKEQQMRKQLSKTKINIKEVSKVLNNVLNNNESIELKNILKEINELKENIQLIKDKSISREYANNLYEIIKYYIEASSNIKSSDKNKINDFLVLQVKDLSIKVDDELRKEKEDNSCDEMLNTISYQKSIGTR